MTKEAFIFFAVVLLSVLVLVFSAGVDSIAGGVITGDTVTGEAITGSATQEDFNVSIQISAVKTITIDSPENITYNFPYSSSGYYSLDLNVSSDFSVNTWWYDLIDLYHSTTINNSVIFTPNTTINAVRWSNNLTVYANDSSGTEVSSNVTFFINVSNQAPVFGSLASEILVCESTYMLPYGINATDNDEDSLTFDIDPVSPFYVYAIPISQEVVSRQTIAGSEIYSGLLAKGSVGVHKLNLSVTDGNLVDSNSTNITVIEINNAPTFTNIGVQTIYSQGDNATFYHEAQVSDVEDGNQDAGNLTLNITFISGSSLFGITQIGIMNYTSNGSDVGVYNVSICAIDLGISNPHQNISDVCGQDGSNQTTCENFQLTITDDNRAPEILDYSPAGLNFSASGSESLHFNATEYDSDGTTPDAYWYVDGVQKEYDEGSLFDEFTYSFGCGISGSHSVSVNVTDGLISNVSVEWTVNVGLVACPLGVAAGGGGGGGGGGGTELDCEPQWACRDWGTCQSFDSSSGILVLTEEDKLAIQKTCLEEGWGEEVCGYQARGCLDVRNCNSEANKPEGIQACYFTFNPSCSDGIKNCHDGSCEFLADCGGPCRVCATCSDEMQNQGEEGVDCGGPCQTKCPLGSPPTPKLPSYLWLVLVASLLLLVIGIYIYLRILKRIRTLRRVVVKDF